MNYDNLNKTSIRYWQEDDRPREKMLQKGKLALSDSELLAILIGTGSGKQSAVDLGKAILELAKGSLIKLTQLSSEELCSIRGIGPSKAVSILAAIELGNRRHHELAPKLTKINAPKDIATYLWRYFTGATQELFYVTYLNNSNEILGIKQLSSGGFSATIVDPRIVFKEAFELRATSMILAHNHPAGTLSASKADIEITKQLISAGGLLQIRVLDHLIFANSSFISMVQEGNV